MPNDFLNTEVYLTDAEQMIRDMLREFLSQSRVVELVRNRNNAKQPIPLELMRELAQLGIFGIGVDGYTCEPVDAFTYGIIMQEVERRDSALRSFASVQNGLVMYPIWQFGSEEQKQYWLPRLKDEGKLNHVHISAGKLHNVRIACEVASKARNILGAAGITYEMPVGAHLLNLESVKTYEGTEGMHTLIIGKHLTGFDAI